MIFILHIWYWAFRVMLWWGRRLGRSKFAASLFLLSAAAAFAQTPACTFKGVFTAATHGTPYSNNTANPNCNAFSLTWNTTGFSAISIQLEGSDDNSTYAAFTGASTVIVGTNPSGNLSGVITVQASSKIAFIRVSTASVTGSGQVNYQVYGYNGISPAAKSGGAGGSCAALGGDLSGTCASANVIKVNNGSIPVSQPYVGTNGSGQFVAGYLTFAGDVTGTPGAMLVDGIEGQLINGSPVNGAGLIYDAVSGKWLYVVPSSGQVTQNGLISGGGVAWTGSGLNFIVSAANYVIAGVTYNSPQTSLTLAAADPSNPRIDVFAVNDSGAAVVITGTPSATPVAPSVDPTSQLELTFVTVPAGASTPSITNDIIYQDDAGPPGEWTTTVSGTGWVAGSTSGCYLSSAKCIEATTVAKNTFVNFAKGSTEPASNFSQLVFFIKSKAAWTNARSLTIAFSLSGKTTGTAIQFNNGTFGFVSSNTASYQQIVIPLSQFNIPGNLDSLRMTVTGSGASTIGFWLDNIFLQTGTPVAPTTGITSLCNNTGPTISAATLISNCGLPQGTVTNVTATAPLTSSGGATPNISATYQGNGAKVQASTGTTTTNDCVKFDSNGNTVDAGAPCGTGSGTVTNVTASSPLGSTGGTTPNISITSSTGSGAVVLAGSPALTGSPTAPTQTTGDNTTKVATDAFVTTAINNAIAGVNPAVAVQAATTAAGDTSGLTYNNGVSGIGATFTGSNNTALTIDGFTFTTLGQRLLVKNDTQSPSGAFNGVYYVTQVQALALPPILTRALDYDTPSDINNTGAIPVVNGTANATTSWLLTSSVNTVGTDPLTYVQFSVNPTTILTGTPTNHGVAFGGSSQVLGFSSAGTSHQYMASGGASANGAYQDHPDILQIPFANCISGTAGGGPSTASSNFTAACRAGTNNLGGADQAIPSTGASLQFFIELPKDWDTSSQPFINVYYGSGSNTSGTVIWTASSACVDVSTPGGASDDPSFNSESAFSTQTMANANRLWFIGGQFTAMTSGNGCKAQSVVIVKLALSGTASSNINAYYAVMTIPRQPVVQAN